MSKKHRRIKFVELIGKGAFGEVYLVDVHRGSNFVQRIALKLLKMDSGGAEIAARLRDEARLLAQLNHDNIIKVHDLGEVNGRPGVFMEYVPGVNAQQLINATEIPPKAAIEMAGMTAAALSVAHRFVSPLTSRPLNVIHRDIKPANLLLSRYGNLKVLDFGIAKASFDREADSHSFQAGTPRYMAPERWKGRHCTPKADVYSLGVTLLELLCSEGMDAPSRLANHEAQMAKQIQRLDFLALPSGVRSELKSSLRRALSEKPSRRLSAQAFGEELLSIAEDLPGEGLRQFGLRVVPGIWATRRKQYSVCPLPEETISGPISGLSSADFPVSGSYRLKVLAAFTVLTAMSWTLIKQGSDSANDNPPSHEFVADIPVLRTQSPDANVVKPTGTEKESVKTQPNQPKELQNSAQGAQKESLASREKKREHENEDDVRFKLTISSIPWGAEVWIDGKSIGKTLLRNVLLRPGTHQIKMSLGEQSVKRRIKITKKTKGFMWDTRNDRLNVLKR